MTSVVNQFFLYSGNCLRQHFDCCHGLKTVTIRSDMLNDHIRIFSADAHKRCPVDTGTTSVSSKIDLVNRFLPCSDVSVAKAYHLLILCFHPMAAFQMLPFNSRQFSELLILLYSQNLNSMSKQVCSSPSEMHSQSGFLSKLGK